ncbi:hypothetical protein FZC33_28895 [Labrys sp. KNU-23]|uniref:hypothetical protein n=1 Tax=Labrys sp. KNU-23 TaxID=2789216 RepID=UPI0011EE3BB8|nr:hypothetical protein [Labrys sp. KNU-23]QEN90078.1 hypothetical protein FZC33_28895 [Labrys sp. KNU-23]
MGFQDGIRKVSLTPQHLIVEEKYTSSPLFDMVAPSQKVKGIKVAGVKHVHGLRRVVTLARVEDVYFKGRKLPGMPGARELFEEWITPGQQLTTRATGELTLSLTYVGKYNAFNANLFGSTAKKIPLGFIDYWGEDPAPGVILQTNAAVPFVQYGDENLIAAAYYNTKTKRLEILRQFNVKTLADDFIRRFAPEYSSGS